MLDVAIDAEYTGFAPIPTGSGRMRNPIQIAPLLCRNMRTLWEIAWEIFRIIGR